MNSDITLELKDINQHFKEGALFKEKINITLTQDSATLLYGGSGAGKTTLLNILIALASPTEGSVKWGDDEIKSLKEANKLRTKYMSVVFSNFSFINELSIKENILLPASLCKIENAEEKLAHIAKTILNFKEEDENIDLDFLINKDSIGKLSNGQKEIIVIASTLLLETKFFIADEMLRSFPEATKVILFKRLMAYFKENKIGFFYVTHWKEASKLIQESEIKHNIYLLCDKRLKLTKDLKCD